MIQLKVESKPDEVTGMQNLTIKIEVVGNRRDFRVDSTSGRIFRGIAGPYSISPRHLTGSSTLRQATYEIWELSQEKPETLEG